MHAYIYMLIYANTHTHAHTEIGGGGSAVWPHAYTPISLPAVFKDRLLSSIPAKYYTPGCVHRHRYQYLYFCTSKASKLSACVAAFAGRHSG